MEIRHHFKDYDYYFEDDIFPYVHHMYVQTFLCPSRPNKEVSFATEKQWDTMSVDLQNMYKKYTLRAFERTKKAAHQ